MAFNFSLIPLESSNTRGLKDSQQLAGYHIRKHNAWKSTQKKPSAAFIREKKPTRKLNEAVGAVASAEA